MADAASPPVSACSLTVWVVDTVPGATAAIPRLERLAAVGVIAVEDSALVAWPRGRRKPSTRMLGALSGPGTLWGGFWGVLLGLIFLVPLAGPTFGAAAGAFAGGLADFGVDDAFVKRVRDAVTPGSSALFLLSSGAVADALVVELKDLGVVLIRSDLSEDHGRCLRETLGEESEVAGEVAAVRGGRLRQNIDA
jgi:uncharacterized membrane protein